MESLVYIPTNRASDEAVLAYADEAEALMDSGVSCAFALVEANEGPHVARHGYLLAERRATCSVPLLHLPVRKQRSLLSALADLLNLSPSDRSWLRTVLLPAATNYSAGPNKAALVACVLGARSLHRRDSDTLPDLRGPAPGYPSQVEVHLLGKTTGQLGPDLIGSEGFRPDAPVVCVGTDYAGAGAFDRDDFAQLSPDLLLEHAVLEHPGATREALQERAVRRAEAHDAGAKGADGSARVDDLGLGEMGACSVLGVFRSIPENPLGDTLGTDYFVRNLVYRLGLPVVYHGRQVLHGRLPPPDGEGRAAGFVEYALRDARFKVMKRIWDRLNRRLSPEFTAALPRTRLEIDPATGLILQCRLDAAGYAAGVDDAIASTPLTELVDLVAQIAALYGRAVTLAARKHPAAVPGFEDVASVLRAEPTLLINEVIRGFRDFARLCRMWPDLVNAADRLKGHWPATNVTLGAL